MACNSLSSNSFIPGNTYCNDPIDPATSSCYATVTAGNSTYCNVPLTPEQFIADRAAVPNDFTAVTSSVDYGGIVAAILLLAAMFVVVYLAQHGARILKQIIADGGIISAEERQDRADYMAKEASRQR